MRRNILLFITISTVAVIVGIAKKQTYTDLVEQGNYLEQLQIAELTENIAENDCVAMQQSLPDAAIILRVEVIGELEHLFQVDRQKVVIQKVYAGNGLERGEEIYLFSDHWQLILDGNPDSLERGFVNIMNIGTEYLIFADVVVENYEDSIPIVKLCDDFNIAPVFSYEEQKNVVIPIMGDTTYVSYKDVMYNEFFVASEEALQMIEWLKVQMLLLYPR